MEINKITQEELNNLFKQLLTLDKFIMLMKDKLKTCQVIKPG